MVCDRFIFQSHSVFGRPTLFAFPTTSIIQFFNPLKIVHRSARKLPKNVFCFLFVGIFNLQQELHAIFIENQILNLNNRFTFLN